MSIERINRYCIRIDGYEIPADEQQEAAIRNMTPQQRRNFLDVLALRELSRGTGYEHQYATMLLTELREIANAATQGAC